MIARAVELEFDRPEALPRVARRTATRTARGAAERRRARTRAAGRRGLSRLIVLLGIGTIVISGYLALLGNVMWMQLEIDKARGERATAEAKLLDLDDRLAHAESREALMHAAGILRMHDPAAMALVTLPPPPPEQPKASGIAFFTGWLH